MTETLQVTAPFDGQVLDELPYANESQVEELLSSAYALFLDRERALPAFQRIEILEKLAQLMDERRDELTKIAAAEGGKPWKDSVVEVDRAIQGVRLGIHALHDLGGEEIPMGITASSTNRLAFTTREPIGVVVSLSAFNHPLNLIVHQTVPAIAAGCPVIVKPAGTTPRSCFRLIELMYQAGLPEDWCRGLVCSNELAEKLATDSRVGYLSFIGSPRVGWYLRSKLAPGARCALEHGGAAPVIVAADAEFDSMLPLLAKGGFYHAGQVCVSVQRVYCEASRAQEVADGLVSLAERQKVGDPLDQSTDIGPLILPREVDRVESWVAEAAESGGQVITGGERISDTCFAPTVILDPPTDAQVSTHEIFGPVICVYPYQDRVEAISRANSLPFAFQGSVFTKDLDTALDTARRLNATAVMINDHTAFRVDWMPFGGRDQSGIGMGGIPYTLHEMTREKLIVFRSNVL